MGLDATHKTRTELNGPVARDAASAGQGLALPGYADDKMAAIARQWKAARRALKLAEGWALFYLNAHFDWPFFAVHSQMEVRV